VSLAERPRLRLATLAALFFAQGVPFGFFAVTLFAYVSARGASTTEIASVLAMSYWPYVFKWVGGPLIDTITSSRFGRRRPWIVGAQMMMAASLVPLLFIDDVLAQLDLVLVLILVHTTFNALQNVATDALAIDLLDPGERGRANGVMYGAKYLGMIVGGAGLTRLVTSYGLRVAILAQIGLLVATGVLPALVRERGRDEPQRERPAARTLVPALVRVYRLRSPWIAAAAMLTMSVSSALLNVVANKLFVGGRLWTENDYNDLTGGYGAAFGFAGSLVAGALADRIGFRRLVALSSLLIGASWLAFGVAHAWTVRPVVYVIGMLEPFAYAISTIALWSLCMTVTIKRTAATQFAMYTSLTSLSVILGSRLLAPALASASYATSYAVAGAVQFVVITLLPLIDPGQVRRALPDA
jgi:PAT family beta-lactamase induction signal transducer AmpG